MSEVEIWYTPPTKREVLGGIRNALDSISIKVVEMGERALPSYAFDPSRGQYNASTLLSEAQNPRLFLWVVDRDLYVEGMNFVFGLSSRFKGSVLSVYRLPSQEMVEKEAIHEMGHVLGLGHCGNFCVMQFSNSLEEAMEKPGYFCERCRKALRGR